MSKHLKLERIRQLRIAQVSVEQGAVCDERGEQLSRYGNPSPSVSSS